MKNYCLNCNAPLAEEVKFCPVCGQSRKTYLLSIGTLIKDFVGNVFNLDNSVFKSIRYIFQPWKLSHFYIAGKRKQYTNPIRLFMVMMIVHFAVFSYTYLRNVDEKNIGKTTNIYSQVTLSEKLETYDALIDSMNLSTEEKYLTDSIRSTLFPKVKSTDQDTFTPLFNLKISGIDFKEFGILKKDVVNMSENELLEKYNIDHYMDRLLVRQSIRVYNKPVETLRFFIGNLIWGVFLIVLVLGLVLKVLYIRHKMLYVEHVVFLFTFHSTAFLITILAMVADNFLVTDSDTNVYAISIIPLAIWLFVAMRKYYQQGFFKTFLKYIVVAFSYFAALIFVIVIIFFATLLIF